MWNRLYTFSVVDLINIILRKPNWFLLELSRLAFSCSRPKWNSKTNFGFESTKLFYYSCRRNTCTVTHWNVSAVYVGGVYTSKTACLKQLKRFTAVLVLLWCFISSMWRLKKNTVQYQFYFSYAGTIIRRLCRPTIPSLQSAKLVNWLIYIYIFIRIKKCR